MNDKVVHVERVELDAELAAALDALARYQGVHRGDIIVHGIRDWLTAIKALPFHDLDEDGGVAAEG